MQSFRSNTLTDNIDREMCSRYSTECIEKEKGSFAKQLGAYPPWSPRPYRLWLPEPRHPIHFAFPIRSTTPLFAIYHLSHVQSCQPYILSFCRFAHSFTRLSRCYPRRRTRQPEKNVSDNFIDSPNSIRRSTKLSSPLYNRATREKTSYSFYSCPPSCDRRRPQETQG